MISKVLVQRRGCGDVTDTISAWLSLFQISPKEADRMIREADQSGDGLITYNEFYQKMMSEKDETPRKKPTRKWQSRSFK